MKKIISTILVFVLLFTYLCVSASASSKIATDLQQKMSQASDDAKIKVHIWLKCNIDKSEVFRQAIKECGYIVGLPLNMTQEEVDRYREVYNRIISEQEAKVSNDFVKKLGIAEEDIVYLGKHPYVIANLTKEQINKADSYTEVESLSYVEDAPIVEPTDDVTSDINLYEDKVKKIYPFLYNYSELYYHSDSDSNVDWVLITGEDAVVVSEPLYQIIGNRVVIETQQIVPFGFGVGVYDVKQDTCKPIYSDMLAQYDGLEEAFNNYGKGRLLGDLNGDNNISVLDVTILQRCMANIQDFPEDDTINLHDLSYSSMQKYYSDFNRDGERNVLDATAIQRYLIGQ